MPDCVVLDSAYCSMGRMVALHTDATRWGEPATYDLMINTDLIGRDFAAQLLAKLMTGQD